MDAQPLPESCKLNMDVLDLIVYEHRNDHLTLAAIALASKSFLQIARKLLYRSVSLDECENPYGHEQQQRLRSSLASYPHLCSYIRHLRLSLPATNAPDPELDGILRTLVRLETLHIIGSGMGMDYDDVGGSLSYVAPAFGPVQLGNTEAKEGFTARSRCGVNEALKNVFGLRSLKKLTLENIYPLEEVYSSCFTELKHLELLSVGGRPVRLGSLPPSLSNSSSSATVASITSSGSSTSLASHPPPSSPSSPASPLRYSPSSMTSHSGASSSQLPLSATDEIEPHDQERYGEDDDWRATSNLLAPAQAGTRMLAGGITAGSPFDMDLTGTSASSTVSELDSDPVCYRSPTRVAGGIALDAPGTVFLNKGGRVKGSGKGKRGEPNRVFLEYLVLNLEHLRPVLDVICARPIFQDETAVKAEESGEGAASVLDFSRLKQAHIYVWDSDDGHAIWSILETARKSLERLTLRYFDYGEEYSAYHQCFENLQALVLGTRTFSIRDQDPFRPLIQLLTDPSKFPVLRQVKISFDLWGCESCGTSWKEISGYRGWKELDRVFAALDGVDGSSPGPSIGPPTAVRARQLVSVVFELWCSANYKGCRDEQVAGGSASLLQLVQDELFYLKHNKHFVLM